MIARIEFPFKNQSCVRARISFFNNFNFFESQETVNLCMQIFPQNEKNRVISKTTSSHGTLMADNVQWVSQSDYSICISILVEFY